MSSIFKICSDFVSQSLTLPQLPPPWSWPTSSFVWIYSKSLLTGPLASATALTGPIPPSQQQSGPVKTWTGRRHLRLHSFQRGLLALGVKPMSLYRPGVFYVICPIFCFLKSSWLTLAQSSWTGILEHPGMFYLRTFAPPALPAWNVLPCRYLQSCSISFLLPL